MSYEGKMLADLKMPLRKEVEKSLLISLFNYNGAIKEFNSNESIVREIADAFNLNDEQRNANLETIYRKENRIKRSSLWHRLLFRAADNLAKENLVSKPTITFNLTKKKEWMLTEAGYDKALKLLKIPNDQKNILAVKSFEVQNVIKKLNNTERPELYNPFDEKKPRALITKEISIRRRGFRQAVIEAYDYKCAVCGLKIYSPDKKYWEAEAAHIVPYKYKGKDEVLNGLSLCSIHHWAFDVGWFSIENNFTMVVSPALLELPEQYNFFKKSYFQQADNCNNNKIFLPENKNMYPHPNALEWHRNKILFK